jgi:hypothetical protein
MASYLAADLSLQLAKLLHKDVVRIRKTAGSPVKISVIDVIMANYGCDATSAAGHLHRFIDKYAYIGFNCEHVMLPGAGQVLMADLATIVNIVSLIPEYRPEEVREEAAKLFVRYIGGDLDRERYPLQDAPANIHCHVPQVRQRRLPVISKTQKKRQRCKQLSWPPEKVRRYEEYYQGLILGLQPNTVIFFTHARDGSRSRTRTGRIFSEFCKAGLDFMDFPLWMAEDAPHAGGFFRYHHPVDEVHIMGDILKTVSAGTFEEKLARGTVVAMGKAAHDFFRINYRLHVPCCTHPCIWTAQRKQLHGLTGVHTTLAKAFAASGQQLSLQELDNFIRKGSNFCYTGPVLQSSSMTHMNAVERRREESQPVEVL